MEMIIMFIVGVIVLFIVIENAVRIGINNSIIGKRYSEMRMDKPIIDRDTNHV